jgi:hypothetical protein
MEWTPGINPGVTLEGGARPETSLKELARANNMLI